MGRNKFPSKDRLLTWAHLASLRQKLEVDPKKPQFFVTVQGLGYKILP
jgi:DNA-binding response OmpR family regulator